MRDASVQGAPSGPIVQPCGIGLPHSVDDTVAGVGSQEGADWPAHTDGGQVGERRGAVLCGHTRNTSRRLAETASRQRSVDNKKA